MSSTYNPRDRNRLSQGPDASQRATLPALPGVPQSTESGLREFLGAVKERLEVREGTRGNPYEKAVTKRDLVNAGLLTGTPVTSGQTGLLMRSNDGVYRILTPDDFAEIIKDLKLYKDLLRRLDDTTRFDDLPEAVREILLKDIAEEAAARGADIQRIEKILQSNSQSTAMLIEEVTGAVAGAQAGIRTLQFAAANLGKAIAGEVVQVQARLDDFGGLGASVEQTMLATADAVTGLRAEYFVKVQAGNKLAGFGLAASEDPDGNSESAFIVLADRFAVVTNSDPITDPMNPPAERIPFGVDASGVYIKGLLRVDSGGPSLDQIKAEAGRRGAANLVLTGSTWNSAAATAAVASSLDAPNSTATLRLGDTVTIRNNAGFAESRYWDGTAWVPPGTIIDGNLLVSGSVAAHKINAYGLQIQDQYGNVILGAGASLPVGYINGLGGLATKNTAAIGSEVRFPDGSVMNTGDFVNKLSKIDNNTIGNFMSTAAIGSAYIGNAAVQTLNIAGNAVTIPASGSSGVGGTPGCALYLPQPGDVYVTATLWMYEQSTSDGGALLVAFSAQINSTSLGSAGFVWQHGARARHTSVALAARFSAPAGYHGFSVGWANVDGSANYQPQAGTIMAVGTMK